MFKNCFKQKRYPRENIVNGDTLYVRNPFSIHFPELVNRNIKFVHFETDWVSCEYLPSSIKGVYFASRKFDQNIDWLPDSIEEIIIGKCEEWDDSDDDSVYKNNSDELNEKTRYSCFDTEINKLPQNLTLLVIKNANYSKEIKRVPPHTRIEIGYGEWWTFLDPGQNHQSI